MGTTLSPDPSLYVHPATHTRRNVSYGPHTDHLLNVYRNQTRLANGNPVIVFTHGGGWGSKDKTSALESSTIEHLFFAYLLNNTYGNTATPFDIVSIQTRMHDHSGVSSAATVAGQPSPLLYEPVYSGTIGTRQSAEYGLAVYEDTARAVQYVKRSAARWGFDASNVVLWGASAGATQSLVVAFSPSIAYTLPTRARDRFEAVYPSTVKGVLNYHGVINLSPWFTDFRFVLGLFGVVTSDVTKNKNDYERIMLVPDASGAYPSTCERTTLCKSVSPTDVIAAARSEDIGAKVRSIYRSDEYIDGTVGHEYVPGYPSAAPPYTPHDKAQLALLQTACDDAGVSHEGEIIDVGLGIQEAYEGSFVDTYAWLVDCVT